MFELCFVRSHLAMPPKPSALMVAITNLQDAFQDLSLIPPTASSFLANAALNHAIDRCVRLDALYFHLASF